MLLICMAWYLCNIYHCKLFSVLCIISSSSWCGGKPTLCHLQHFSLRSLLLIRLLQSTKRLSIQSLKVQKNPTFLLKEWSSSLLKLCCWSKTCRWGKSEKVSGLLMLWSDVSFPFGLHLFVASDSEFISVGLNLSGSDRRHPGLCGS